MTELKMDQVNLSKENQMILKDINLNLESGNIYGLLGRNGAGKTSLLRVLANYENTTSGEVYVNDENSYENPDIQPLVEYISGDKFLDSERAYKIKKYLQIESKIKENFDLEYAFELLEHFKIDKNKKIYQLSKGNTSAVKAICALASNAPILLLDEITNGMDAPTRELFYKTLLTMPNIEEQIVVLSTHYIHEMEYLFNKVIILKDGKIIFNGDTERALSKGYKVSGKIEEVDQFVQGKAVVDEKKMGPIKQVTVLSDAPDDESEYETLHISRIKLQELFISLTNGSEKDE